jgi:hypothetical protein
VIDLSENKAIMPMDHIGQGVEPRDQTIIVKPCHFRRCLAQRMDKGVAQKNACCAATSNGLIEVQHILRYLSIGTCHALRRRRLDEAILES